MQGTKDFGVLYKKNKYFTLVGYSNADFAGDIDNFASNFGYLMNLGSLAISWGCKKILQVPFLQWKKSMYHPGK